MPGNSTGRKPLFRWILLLAAGFVALLLAVVALEVGLTPPPFAPSVPAASGLSGGWRGAVRIWLQGREELSLPVHLEIRGDGALTGLIGQARVEGRLEWNRSWLGRMLNVRTDYIMVGQIWGLSAATQSNAPEKFSAPLTLEGSYFKGSLFLSGRRPARISLFRYEDEPIAAPTRGPAQSI